MGATLEEDAEGFALRSLVERDGIRPEVVLLAEATDLSLRRGQRGRCEVRVRTEGRAAHASQPHLGESAILKMLPVISALEAMNGRLPVRSDLRRGQPGGDADRRAAHAELGAVVVRGRRGSPPGAWRDGRERPRGDPLGRRAVGRDCPYPRPTCADAHRPAPRRAELLSRLAAGEDDSLLGAGKATCSSLWDGEPTVGVWRFSTDGAYSAGAAGIPSLGFGPEEEQYVHTALDQVRLTKLRKAAAFYALFPFVYGQLYA